MRDTHKRYRFIIRTGRNIEVVFSHIPGKHISTGTREITEAVKFAETFLQNDGIRSDEVPLLKDFAANFFLRTDKNAIQTRDRAFRREKRPKWYVRNQAYLENYIIPRFGMYPVDSIQAVAIENWIATFDGVKVKDLSGGSRVKVINCFRILLDDVVRMGYRSDNPARSIAGPSDKPEEERVALTRWEQKTLFPPNPQDRMEIWGGTMWATYFSVMYDTGFRPSEVAGLKVSDVYQSPSGMAVYTSHTMNTEEHQPKERVKTSGKGMESRVGLLSEVTEELIMLLLDDAGISDDNEFLFMTDRREADSYVFADTSNKHFKTIAKRYLGEEAAEGMTQYCLRHTYATYRRGNVDETVLSIAMGHSKGVRDNYDHRNAAMVIRQLENSRNRLFQEEEPEEIVPISIRSV